MNDHWKDAEKVAILTRPTLARRDAPFPMHRSRFIEIVNVLERVASGFDSPAALLDGLFEHPAIFRVHVSNTSATS
jgi:hypothetical protein